MLFVGNIFINALFDAVIVNGLVIALHEIDMVRSNQSSYLLFNLYLFSLPFSFTELLGGRGTIPKNQNYQTSKMTNRRQRKSMFLQIPTTKVCLHIVTVLCIISYSHHHHRRHHHHQLTDSDLFSTPTISS